MKYIVCWADINHEDCWECYDDLRDAMARYSELIQREDTYTLSLATVVRSTDYT